MKMKNREIEGFVLFLLEEELNGKMSRMRSRFIKLAKDQLQQIENERMELIKEFSEKDEDNNPVVETKEDGSMAYKMTDMFQFNFEYTVMMNEDFIIDETEERREMLLAVRDIVFNTEQVFKGDKALQFDRWCEIVEEINY